MVREVDPISSLAFSIVTITSAITLDLITAPTLFPNSFNIAVDPQLAAAGLVFGFFLGLAYNPVDLSDINGIEVFVVMVTVVLILANQFTAVVQDLMSQTAPYGYLVLWTAGTISYLILAYGRGVDWYPFGG